MRTARSGIAVCLMLLAFAASAAAQGGTSGINGRVSDTTGGALPGATVTITSPALQVPSMTTVSEADGGYRFIQLPAGTYEVKYELAGFKATVRQGVVLAVGFIATINPSLEVGGVEETITVSGVSPVVDTTNNVVTSRITPETLAALPSGRRHNDIAMMTPGMMISTAPVVTAVGLASLSNNVSSGGLNNLAGGTGVYYRTSSDGIEHNSGGVRSPDYTNVQEVNITQSGGTADIAQAGIYVNIVSKSGGNETHGRYSIVGTGSSLEGKNIDDTLRAQGITATSGTDWFYDAAGDLGGRIVRDRLWYYGSIRRRSNKQAPFGVILSPGPDKIYGTTDDTYYHPRANGTVFDGKVSWQPSSKWNLAYYANNEHNFDTGGLAGRFTPYEASAIFKYTPTVMKGDVKATLTNHLLITAAVGRDWAPDGVDYYAQPGTENNPATVNLATQYRLGRAFPLDRRQRSKWTTRAEMTYLPSGKLLGLGGAHEFKLGGRTWSAYVDTFHADDPTGNYILVFDTIGGVQNTPSQIRTYNSPVLPHAVAENMSAYVTDRITAGSRLTLNLGVRWDRYHAYVPEAVKLPGPFSAGGTFPAVDAGTWDMPAPRAGFAYNLTKDAKTVLKGTYGWFNDDMLEIYANDYNVNVDVITTYRWHDNNLDKLYQPGEVNLALNGPDFLTQVGAPSNINNPSVNYEHIHELTGSFERELMPGMGLRFLYTYRRFADQYTGYNVLRPYSAYSIPLLRKDPGADGVLGTADDGGLVNVWDFAPAFAGVAFQGTKKLNVPDDNTDRFHSFEATVTKRFSQRWEATVSGSMVKNHAYIITAVSSATNTTLNNISAALPQSPNDEYNRTNDTVDWAYKTTVSYMLPFDVRVASLLFLENGVPGQRTYIFRAQDPLGGPPLRQQATVTLRLDPFGTQRGPVRKVVNLRLSKVFNFSANRKAEAFIDAVNLINSNAAWGSTWQSGPTFGFTTTPFNPRIFQIGGSFDF